MPVEIVEIFPPATSQTRAQDMKVSFFHIPLSGLEKGGWTRLLFVIWQAQVQKQFLLMCSFM